MDDKGTGEANSRAPAAQGVSRRGVMARCVVGAGAAGALAACGQGKESSLAAPGSAPSATTVRYAFYASPPEAEIWKRLCAEFTQQSGRITVEPEHTTGGDHFQKMYALLAAGSEPEVMMWTTKELAGGAIKGIFYPLDDLVKKSKRYKKEDLFPLEWNKNVFRGKVVALPLTHSPAVIFYNKEVFANAGVPEPPHKWDDAKWTWDALLELSRKLTKVGPSPDTAEFGYDNGDSWWFVQPFIWSNGSDYLSKDHTKVQIDAKPVVEAFQWVADLRLKHKVGPTAEDRALTQGGTTGMFFTNKLAMFVAITSTSPVLAARDDLKWDIGVFPHRTEQAWTRNPQLDITISRNNGGKRPEDAWLAMEYLAGEPGQRAMAELHRGLPANKKVAYSEAWLTPGAQHDWRVFIDAAEKYSHPEHEIIKFPEMNKLIQDAFGKELLSGKATAAQMAAAIKPPLEELIRENTQLTSAGAAGK